MEPWTEDAMDQRRLELADDPAPKLFADMLMSALVLQALQAPSEWRRELLGLACELESIGMPPGADRPLAKEVRSRALEAIRGRYGAMCNSYNCDPAMARNPEIAGLVTIASEFQRAALQGVREELRSLELDVMSSEAAMLEGDIEAAERYIDLSQKERALQDRVRDLQFMGPSETRE